MQDTAPDRQPAERPPEAPWPALSLEPGDRPELCALVLSAVGIDHRLEWDHILVAPADLEQAQRQLRAFRRENRDWPPPARTEPERFSVLRPPTLLAFTGLALFYRVTGPWQDHNPWFAAGAVNSRLIMDDHQWWRLFTGLSLHADLQHLLGNCLIGGLMVHLLCRIIGFGSGWLLLILCGGLGNLINVALRDQMHLSVGFSTAVFSAIGIFSGLRIMKREGLISSLILALGAGLGLLAFLGSEGARTDLGAHLAGFCTGLAAGLLVRPLGLYRLRDRPHIQVVLMALAVGSMILAWLTAARHMSHPLF